MQRDEYFGLVQDLQSFNPHPARRPDATSVVVTPVTRTVDWFQSSSGQKAGCNASRCSFSSSVSSMFQSSSGQKPDATMSGRRCCSHALAVSILIRPEGRMQLHPRRGLNPGQPVQSSSGQKAGCNPL